MSNSIFEVPLPNGTIVEVPDAPNPEFARARARLYFQQSDPEGYAAWAAQQPAGGFVERVGRGVDEMQGRLYGFAEAVGGATGIEGLEQFGREGRRRNVIEAEAAMPEARMRSFGEAEGIGGILRAGQQAIAGSVPELPLPLAGGVAGAAAGSAFGPVGTLLGGIAGAAAGAFPSLTGGNVATQALQEVAAGRPDVAPSPGVALAAAVPQAALSGALDMLTLRLARVIGVPAEEVGRALLPRIARGIGAGAATEVPEEVLQQAIERAQAGQSVLDEDAMRDYREAAAGAVFAGGAFGGTAAGVFGRRPGQEARPPEPPAEEPPAAEAPPPVAPLPNLPDYFYQIDPEPEPITDPEEARRYLRTTGDGESRPGFEVTDEEAVRLANDKQLRTYQGVVEGRRSELLNRFLGFSDIRTLEEAPTEEGAAPTTREVRDLQAVNLQQRLTQLAARPENDLDLENISPKRVAQLVFQRFQGVEQTPTAQDVTRVRQQFEALREAGYFERGSERGTFRFAPRNIENLEERIRQRQPTPAAPPVEQKPGDFQAETPPVAPPAEAAPPDLPGFEAPRTPEQLAERRREAGDVFARTDPTQLVARVQTDDAFATSYLDRLFGAMGKNPSQKGVMTQARREGIILEPEQASQFIQRGKQLGLLNQINNYIPPAKRTAPPAQPPAATPAPAPAPTPVATPPAPPVAQQPPATFKVGDRVQFKWNTGQTVSDGQVLQVAKNGRVKIRGWRNRLGSPNPVEVTEWVPVSNLIPYTRDAQPPTATTPPTPPAEPPAPALPPPTTPAPRELTPPPAPPPAPKKTPVPRKKKKAAPPPTPAPETAAPGEPAVPTAQETATARGGRIVYEDNDVAIIATPIFNPLSKTGLYYIGFDKVRGLPGVRSIESLPDSGSAIFNAEQTARLKQALRDHEAREEAELKANPLGPFKDSNLVVSNSVPDNVAEYAQNLIKMLGLENQQIMLMSGGDGNLETAANYNLLGRYRSYMLQAEQDVKPGGPSFGVTVSARSGPTHYVVGLRPGMKPAMQFETLAHEIGHVFQRVALDNADAATQAEIQRAFEAWLAKNKSAGTATYLQQLRTYQTAQELTDIGLPDRVPQAANLAPYWHSFNEWFADQVARWATTDQQPVSLIDRFFKSVANAYKKIVNSLSDRLAPDTTVANFIRSYVNGQYRNPSIEMSQGLRSGANAGIAFLTPELDISRSAATGESPIKKATRDYITGPLKWVASPIMTIGKVRQEIKPAADVQEGILHRKNAATIDLESRVESFARLNPASRKTVTEAWAQASRTRKAPDTSALTAEEKQALSDLIAGGQRAFDWLVESYVLESFNPAAATNAADKARLEAFWARNIGKHLWEIPEVELRAASPKGFSEMQSMQRLRNPYYMPMIATGSHFLAVYKRGPDGERTGKPLRMIAFTPLNFAQKMRNFANPEAEARAELQRQFPDASRYYISERPTEFSSDNDAQQLRGQGDFIAEYLQRLTNIPKVASSREAQNLIGSMLRQLDKAQLDRVFRPNQDILQAVTPANVDSYVMDTVPRYFLGVANIAARRATQGDWARAIQGLSNNDREFLNDLRDYSTTPTEAFSGARTAAFFMLLGGALDTAALNALQVFQTTMPMLVRDGGIGALKHIPAAYNLATVVLGKALKKNENISDALARRLKDPAEKAAFEQALKLGVFQPLFTNESRGQVTVEGLKRAGVKNAQAWANRVNYTARLLGSLQQNAEQYNRAITFIAAYRAARENPSMITKANKYDNTNYVGPTALFDYAVGKVADTQFTTTKEDRAYFQRFTPGAELATQFMSFPVKMFEQFARHFMVAMEGIRKADPDLAKAGAVGFLGMAAPIVGLAGVWALPGADFLRELLERIINLFWGGSANFDSDFRRWLGGGQTAEAFSRGVPHAFNSAALSRRLAVDPIPFNDLANAQVLSLFGPFGSILESPVRAYEAWRRGNYWDVAASLSPRALGNVIRGADIAYGTGEVRSLRGNTLVSREQIEAIDSASYFPVALRVASGFGSPSVVSLRDGMARAEEIARQNRAPQERLNQELSGYIADMIRAGRNGSGVDNAQAMRRFQERVREVVEENQKHIDAGRLDRVLNINMQALQRQAYLEYSGRTSPEALARAGSPRQRAYIAQEVELYNWRPTTRAQ